MAIEMFEPYFDSNNKGNKNCTELLRNAFAKKQGWIFIKMGISEDVEWKGKFDSEINKYFELFDNKFYDTKVKVSILGFSEQEVEVMRYFYYAYSNQRLKTYEITAKTGYPNSHISNLITRFLNRVLDDICFKALYIVSEFSKGNFAVKVEDLIGLGELGLDPESKTYGYLRKHPLKFGVLKFFSDVTISELKETNGISDQNSPEVVKKVLAAGGHFKYNMTDLLDILKTILDDCNAISAMRFESTANDKKIQELNGVIEKLDAVLNRLKMRYGIGDTTK